MPKNKAAPNCKIPFWLSARADCKEGRFIQVGNSLLLSKKFQELSSGAQHLYICMTMESGGKRDFAFSKATAKKYGISGSTLLRRIEELERHGFIQKTVCGRITREKNQYIFSLTWRA